MCVCVCSDMHLLVCTCMRTEHAHNGQHFVPSFMLKCNNVPRKGGGVVLFSMQIYMLQQVLSFTIQKFMYLLAIFFLTEI